MEKNVGTVDMWIRIVLAVVFFVWGLYVVSAWKWLLFVVALVLLVTAGTRKCPLYTLIKK